ncbi:hypothetical protein B0H10DRAFT_2128284 [Mycena sp. CBHHK59/15]|nr:hypothetical protein B0H10DRAFT_2128284 [Mycena sp. CBHHK59/15]
MILPGAIDLRREIRVEHNSGIVRRHRSANSAKRMYSARIDKCSSDMTIAVYQGQHAEEDWRRDLDQYSGIHHPNFLQIYGAVQSSGLHAVVFYDDLVPLDEMYDSYHNSPILYVYLGACVACISSRKSSSYHHIS